ncbi:MAG: hypothetical protein JWO41_347 [Candidatus Saccharibacteria bacterium]|nr:hypothetical protein [Candidatus Saccharibacteria bacterium]
MNVLSDRITLPNFFRAAANACSHVTKQKQRFTALFFVALLIFQGIAGFEPLLAHANGGTPDPLKQVEKASDLPQAVSKAPKTAAQAGKSFKPNESFTKKPADKTVVSEVPTDEYNTVTTYTDGSQKIHSSAVQVNEKDGKGFTPISRRLNEDALTTKNAAGQTLDLTKVIKQSGQFTPKSFTGKSKVRGFNFPTLDGGQGITLTSNGKTVTIYPQNANALIIPTKHEGKSNDYIVYENVWKNVDLQYDYLGTAIKESIVIKSADAANEFKFKIAGGTVVKKPSGNYSIEGTDISIGEVKLSLYNQGVVTAPLSVSNDGSSISVTLDGNYLKGLKPTDFPAVIDPDYYAGSPSVDNNGANYVNFDNYGNQVNSSQDWMDLGSTRWSNGQIHDWHTIFHIPYDQIFNRQLDYAQFNTAMRFDARAGAGSPYNWDMWLTWAPAFSFNYGCCGEPAAHGIMGQYGSIDATGLFNWMKGNVGNGGWIELWSNEGNGASYKRLDPYSTDIDFYVEDYNSQPSVPGIVTPANGQVFADQQPSFQMTPSTDANGDPLKYWFRVTGSNPGNCSAPGNILVDSGEIDSLQWTVPDGVLKDGDNYWFCGYVHDQAEGTTHSAGNNFWNWTAPIPFKVDLRLGKDKTQTYDDVGPFSVNYSNGNVTMSAASHTMNALGGSMGVNLEYNSPYASRSGLNAAYYNNSSQSGAPAVSRVDGSVDFDWSTGSPSPNIVNNDNFSARWTGYFVAPETGNYTFGGKNDDAMKVIINNNIVYSNNCYNYQVCWGGTPVALQQGQVVPILVDFTEATGPAYVSLYASFNGKQQVVPKAWLRTEPTVVHTGNGLTGRYFKLESTDPLAMPTDGRQPFLSRNDTTVNFDWGVGSPIPGAPSDRFAVRWTGFITVPQDDSYTYCVASDDGMRLSFDNVVYRESWQDQGGNQYCGAALGWKAGETHAVTLEYYENGGGAAVHFQVAYANRAADIVPATWLTPSVKSVPDGWTLGIDPDGNVSYEAMQVAGSGNVTLYDSTGEKHLYTWTGSAYTPPVNEHGVLARNSDNTYTLQDDDGRTYIFNQSGVLITVTTPQDDRQPAALQYTYGGTPARIQKIVDGVDTSRTMSVYYGGDSSCPATASGFDATPPNMLCAVTSTDGNYTYFRYRAGFLARIETNGGVVTDLAYDSLGRIIQVREPLANDALGAGVRAMDDSVTTQITYDAIGRAATVTLPAATAGATRGVHTYQYTRLPDSSGLGTTAMLDTNEAMPLGYSQKIDYDTLLREVNSYDKQGLKTYTQWDQFKDLSLATVDPTGLESTTLYNDADLPTDTYGPAPSGWFDTSTRKPTTVSGTDYTSQVPHTQTQYDQGITGLAVTYFARKTLTGAPGQHATGFNNAPATSMSYADGVYPVTPTDGFSLRATGKIRLAEAGNHTFRVASDGGARLYIDGNVVVDDWTDGGVRSHPTGNYNNVTGGTLHDITVEYYHSGTTGPGSVQLFKTSPGASESGDLTGILSPNYALTTATTVYDSQQGNITTITNYGSRPEFGQAQSVTEDNGGLNLTTGYTYEAQGTGSYLRQTSKTLPGGAKTQYQYYSATDTRDNPCTTSTETYHQAGMMKGKVQPDPDGSGAQPSITSESIYDDSGRVVATRTNSDAWTCTFYDARGRIVSTSIPAVNGQPARTITNNYWVGSSPLVTSSGDSNGTVTTETDLFGRPLKYTDARNNVTTYTYDAAGRLMSRTSPLGSEAFTYDGYDRLTDQMLDGATLAHVSYDAYGRISSVNYSAGAQQLSSVNRDNLGRTNGLTYKIANGQSISDVIVRNVSGDVVSGTENGLSKTYAYDTGGRLLTATLGSNNYNYDYTAPTSSQCSQASANLNANKDGNRTKYIVNGATATTYCYDQADRLISSSDPTIGTPVYDAHGNTTQLGSPGNSVTAFNYDASDRNTGITQTTTTQTTTTSTKNNVGQTTTTVTTVVNTKKIVYTRDVQGRLTSRVTSGNTATTTKTTTITGTTTKTATTTDTPTTSYYGYTGSGDTPDFVLDSSNAVVEKYQQLPGNVLLTIRPKETDATKKTVYSLPNIHGDIFATTTSTGTLGTTYLTGPFGEQIANQAKPANTLAGASFGYVGQYEKLTESNLTLNPVQMGARVYIPSLGRFLQVDPQEGGTDNNYVYSGDPVNEFDLDGNAIPWRKIGKGLVFAAGIAGAIACGASIVCGVAVGAAAAGAAYAATNAGTKHFKWSALGKEAAIGGALGGVAGGAQKLFNAAKGGVYIARTATKQLYVGQTNNFAIRAAQHARAGKIASNSMRVQIPIASKWGRNFAERSIYNALGTKKAPWLANKIRPPHWR